MSLPEIFDGNEWQQISYVQSVLYGTVSNTYTTDLTDGNHFKFDLVEFQKGANITLDTSTLYTTSANADSVGRIKLLAGRVYKLAGSFNKIEATNASPNLTQWYNADSDTPIGLVSSRAIAFVKPSVDTRVELRILFGNNILEVPGKTGSNEATWFYCEEIG
jgi:hypothetical protein